MSHLIVNTKHLTDLVKAAQNIQRLMDDCIIGEAFNAGTPEQVNATICAFDDLAACATVVNSHYKQVSPFLRYRREILGHYDTASRLRALVLNLWGGRPANLSLLFMTADEHHTRIALECIASYTALGENDSQFMGLAMEIAEAEQAAAEQAEEVAA